MVRRLCLSAMLASGVALGGNAAWADPDLGEMVGTIARSLMEQQQVAQDAALWDGVVDNGTAAAYRQYLNTYPQGVHAREARQRLSDLEQGSAPGNTTGQGTAAQAEARLGLTRADRVAIQRRLAALDFYNSGIDGVFGAGTRRAIAAWQASRQLPGKGYLNANQSRRLLGANQAAPAPAPGPDNSAASPAQAELDLGLTRNARVQIQRNLIALGYDPKGADGLFGMGTRDAIRGWQQSNGQRATGYVTAAQVRSLQAAADARGTGSVDRPAAAIDEDLLGLTRAERTGVQQRLIGLGYLTGGADGVFGSATRNAIRRWQGDNGAAESGYLTAEQVRTLQRQARI
ncbi:peptidoglycan-binding protein [Paracoccus nototheniae]|uniref:Peptidoglycan-binding protein n=1 Tax=Paracoccus nototheniae TaxID=2489002 RepID=A0ABW4DW40_9RHOB|nr:peptidoglycan-binding protein [Paracoccus nototheniae]